MTAPATGAPSPAPRSRLPVWIIVTGIAAAWSLGLARHNYALHTFAHAGSWSLQDEGSQTLMPLLVLRGKVPYHDFEPRHTPLGYYILAAALAVGGVDLYSMRLALAATNVCTALVVFAFARRAGAGRWAFLAPLGTLLWGVAENNVPVPRWMAVPVGLFACLALARSAPRPILRDVLCAGGVAGITFLISQNTGIITLAVLVWSLCLWRCARESGVARPAPLGARIIPVAGALTASAVLARMVWLGAVSPAWVMLAGPGLGVPVLILLHVARGRAPSTASAVQLLRHLLGVGVAFLLPIGAMTAWYVAQGGWAPIQTSLAANWGGLSAIYTLPPPAPPRLALGVVGIWAASGVALALPAERVPARVRLGCVAMLLVCGCLALWSMWRPAVHELHGLARFIALNDKLIGLTWLHALWLVGPSVVVVVTWTAWRTDRPFSRVHAVAAMAGLASVGYWGVMFPWADYYHALWAAPPAAVGFAVLARRVWTRTVALAAAEAHPSRWTMVVAGAAALVPASFLLATCVKWSTYWLDIEQSLLHRRPVPREWRRLDPQHGNIFVNVDTHAEWSGLLAYVRAQSAPDDPVLGLPYLPLLYVLADRPFPLYDPFWHPDFDDTVRHAQRSTMLHVLQRREAALIVGPVTDDTYFALPLLRDTWPDAWDALSAGYARAAVFGRYWVFQRRPIATVVEGAAG